MVMTVKDLLRRNPKPNRQEIIHGIESNFCRCTGYDQMIDAVLDVTGQWEDKPDVITVKSEDTHDV
jgi:carbon-monoxide dehydrogenase small subunit